MTLLLPSATPAQENPGYEAALARYRECMARLPFRHHTEGRQRLARTGRQEALDLLVKDYEKPAVHPEHTRYTLASLFGRHFDAPETAAALRALRERHDGPVDMWLWVGALQVEANRFGAEGVLAIATGDRDATRRAVAIAALGRARSSALSAGVLANCSDFPRREAERSVLLGAMSGAIHDNRRRLEEQDYRTALRAYIGLLAEDVDLTHTQRLQVARHLQWTLSGPALFDRPEPWLELLDRTDAPRPASTHTVTAPRFFGIETEGERFCYVVDLSDSMCKEIHPSVRPSGPTTGPKPAKKPRGVLPDESDLPWHEIRTRFDLARAHLRISLQRLAKDKYFSVVVFGTKAEPLESCRGLVKATPGNIKRVIAELDAIEIGPPEPKTSPEGTLRGRTNMHAGLRMAFGLSGKGYVGEAAYVDPAALTQGCDTIFLLSDGAPSWDDFDATDKDYGEGQVIVDTEYAEPAPRRQMLVYTGPYVDDPWLVDDFERMNAFRRVVVHCIGIGEAKMSLLRQLAKIGHGEVMAVGQRDGGGEGR